MADPPFPGLPPSGRQVVLVHGNQEATVVEVGGGLRSYQVGGVAILDGYPEDQMCAGGRGQPLLPWPNRLADGRYTWAGHDHQLALSEPATSTAIHGLTRWLRWDVAAASTSSVTMSHRLLGHPGYPWVIDVAITYRLDDGGLHVVVEAVNRSPDPAPWGIGFHPYLSAFGGTVDGCTLTVPAGTAYDIDARGLPIGRHPVDGGPDDYRAGRVIGDRHLDLPLTDLHRGGDGLARVVLQAPAPAPAVGVASNADPARSGRTTLWVDEGFTHLQVFSGDTLGDADRRRRGLAVEPMTGPANLLASGDGRRTLEPGVAFHATWGIEPG
jgi:aldose 1-epimerase